MTMHIANNGQTEMSISRSPTVGRARSWKIMTSVKCFYVCPFVRLIRFVCSQCIFFPLAIFPVVRTEGSIDTRRRPQSLELCEHSSHISSYRDKVKVIRSC